MPGYAKGNKVLQKFMVAGVRHTRMFDTAAEGDAWELQARAAIKLGKPIPEPEGKPAPSVGGGDSGTLAGLLRSAEKMHWENLKDPKASERARMFVDWVGPKLTPTETLTSEKIEEFVSEVLDGQRNVANATVNRYLSSIGILVKFAGKKITKPDISHLWRKEKQGRIRWFSDEEEKLVLQTWLLWSRTLERDFFIFLIDTGARPFAEGVEAKWEDFNNRKVTFWDTKNGKSRTIPMTTRSWEAVMGLKKRLGNQPGPFSDIIKHNIDRLWDRTRIHLPALHDTVLYTTRHTCCSRLVQRGADLMRVKEWMGHSSITTTMRYAHLAPQHLMDVAHLLEGDGKPKLVDVGGR